MKSIMQQKDGTCYLCMKLNQDYSVKYVEEHHCIYGSGRRPLSDEYGLMVYLCKDHHTGSKNSVHADAKISAMVKQDAQKAFMKNYPDLDFLKIFGKNYILD